jgi:trk system potassium uptake protein
LCRVCGLSAGIRDPMVLKPTFKDVLRIGYYLGKIVTGLGLAMFLPLGISVFFGETGPALDFLISIEVALIIGALMSKLGHPEQDLSWMQGMIVVAMAWFAGMVLGALPLYLSGHYASYLDACFEAMSGLATTGLTLTQDLDHLSYGHQFWRHLTMFIGGQGIVIVALSFFVKGMSGAFKMYVGEGRDERVLPNVLHTARFIWMVSLVFFVLGTVSLGVIGMCEGMSPANAFFHGACIFMATFDTGGFAPQSQNILYYHSFPFEIATMVFMVLGAINFKLHYHLWNGNRRELFRNIEMIVLLLSLTGIFALVALALGHAQVYTQPAELFRKGFYQLISGHTGTGFQTVYAPQFMHEWTSLSLVGLVMAMSLGGAICSTTGGIKMLRVGIIFRALQEDIKRIILPERAIVVKKFHHIKDVFLEDKQVRSAFMITMAYLLLYTAGTLVGMLCGYPFLDALFESTSAGANVGLSCGITQVSMPAILKITYIVEMWAGRLEFIALFTLVGFFVAAIRGKR